MSELHVIALLPTKPEGTQQVREALSMLTSSTRAEKGCVAYHLYESQAAPGTFVTVEEWDSQADLDAHLAGPGVAAALGAVGHLLDGEPQIHALTFIA